VAPAAKVIDDAVPTGKLPADVHVRAMDVTLDVDPTQADGFRGEAVLDIELREPRHALWLHGKHLRVDSATLQYEGEASVRTLRWSDAHESGVANLRGSTPLRPGKAQLRVRYAAPWSKGLEGLHRVTEAGEVYAFTQFEAISAREAFPCFDEPRFKVPVRLALAVPSKHTAVANTAAVSERPLAGDKKLVQFAPTEPIPTYLVAFAVGALETVDAAPVPPNAVRAKPLPLRAVTPKGRGKDVAYALSHTGEFVTALELYTGVAYPYGKLDILAVPEKEGAMENPGAITFAESLLLFDPKTAPVSQKRAYASVMAHELAHQWFGNLVTTAWWDDIWLNESFATWLAGHITEAWDPKSKAELSLVGSIHRTMNIDGLPSTRRIREPILSTHDIANAFDSITYEKGAGVLSMFERWLGKEAFQKGVNAFLTTHAFKAATADDFLAALSTAAGKDVATPFKSFLDQPGVPYLDVDLKCTDGASALALKQSRYAPLGTKPDASRGLWQIPVCAKFPVRSAGVGRAGKANASVTEEQCTLVTAAEETMSLRAKATSEGAPCPAWVFPNAEAAGYYRFALGGELLGKLRKGGASALSERDRVAFAAALEAGFTRGTTVASEVFASLPLLASDARSSVALKPLDFLSTAREWLTDAGESARVEKFAATLYAPRLREVGIAPKSGALPEEDDRIALRAGVVGAMAFSARDAKVRATLAALGAKYFGLSSASAIATAAAVNSASPIVLHPEAVAPDLLQASLIAFVQEGGASAFDVVLRAFGAATDATERMRLLRALGAARDANGSERARALILDERVRASELSTLLMSQFEMRETRDNAWTWLKTHYDAIVERLSPRRASRLAWTAARFCDEDRIADAREFLTPRAERLEGGPRSLAQALEVAGQCVARKQAQLDSMRAFFAKL
jgi:alanyl aminopeptidase